MNTFLSDLPTFIVLAQTASISKASQQLGVPRSTVSRRLKRLEEDLGIPLVEKTTRSIRLTTSGKMLAKEGAELLAQFKTLREKVSESAGKLKAFLRVSSPPGLSGPFLGHFIQIVQSKLPEIRIEYIVREDLPNIIEEGFDLVLTTGPLPDSPWVRQKLGISRYMAVASPQYLAHSPAPRSLTELNQHKLLSIRTIDIRPDGWPLQSGGIVPVVPQMISNDLSSILDAALHGAGIALLPLHLMFTQLLQGQLKPVLDRHLGRPLDIYVLYAAERRKSPVLRTFLDHIDQFGEKMENSIPEILRMKLPNRKK